MKGIIKTPQGTFINMRVSPKPDAEVVAELDNGDAVDVKATQGDWVQVAWEGVPGWVHRNYIESEALAGFFDSVKSFFGFGSNVSPAVAAQPATKFTSGQSLTVNTSKDPLVMRSTASTAGTKVTSVPKGAQVSVADPSVISSGGYAWIKVTYGSYTGYVASEYLSPAVASVAQAAANATPAIVPTSTSTPTNQPNNMTVTEKTKKWLKWGLIGTAAIGLGYWAYSSLGKKQNVSATKRKGLSGTGSKRKSKRKEKNPYMLY